MAKKNNVIEEIQELIQQIKNEYQKGVDYKFVAEKLINERGGVKVNILSSKLKKVCREKFNFPSSANYNNHLDYEKGDQEGNDFYYRINVNNGGYDHLDCAKEQLYRFDDNEKPKKCKVCGEFAFYENGRIAMWDGEKIGYGPFPHIVGYFHTECAKKHFADKEQPNENNNNQRIKEKILRNLDKISLDPIGYLANTEIVKSDIEKDYRRGSLDPIWNELQTKIRKVEIEGEEIDLVKLEVEVRRAVRKAIINKIKQSPQDWKIENSNIYDIPSQNIPDSFKVLRHKSGRRHWNVGIIYLNESLEQGKKDWAEIEALISGSPLPVENQNQTNNWKEGWIEKYFRDNGIYSITLDGDNLVIKYNDKNKKEEVMEAKTPELQLIKQIAAQQKNHSLAISEPQQLKSNQKNNNRQLAIGLAVGASVVIGAGESRLLFPTEKKKQINCKLFMPKNQQKFSPTHPGKIIENRFFKKRNLTIEKVAKDTCLPLYQLQELVEGKRNIDTDTAARLGIYFKVGAEGFLNLQQIYDLEIWKDRQEAIVKKIIHPYQEPKQHGRAKAI